MSNNRGKPRGWGKGNSSTHRNPCRGGCGRYPLGKYCKSCAEAIFGNKKGK